MAENITETQVPKKILDLTFYAFNQRGYFGVSMDQVARELKISKKTIYKHFSSKEEILEKGLEGLLHEIELKILPHKQKPQAKTSLYYISEVYLDYIDTISPILREEIETQLPHIEERIRLFENQVFRKTIMAVLKDGRNNKLFDYPSPTREVGTTYLQLLNGISKGRREYAVWAYKSLIRGISERSKKKK